MNSLIFDYGVVFLTRSYEVWTSQKLFAAVLVTQNISNLLSYIPVYGIVNINMPH